MCLAVPAKVKTVRKNTALVDFGGVTKEISLGITSDVQKNDYVLVHAGFAIGKVEKLEAEDTLKIMQEIRELTKRVKTPHSRVGNNRYHTRKSVE